MGMTSKKMFTKKPNEMPLSNPTSTVSNNLNPTWVAQCANCLKWRILPTEDLYEEIRSNVANNPFVCSRKPNTSCEDPKEIEFDGSQIWIFDQPNIPKTPAGFKRKLTVRKDSSAANAYYITPTGKRLRNDSEVTAFLNANPEFDDLSISDFSFAAAEKRQP